MRENSKAIKGWGTFGCNWSHKWLISQHKKETSANALAAEDIATFARERLGFNIEASQLALLQSNAKRGIVNCARQFGKSSLGAIKAIYRAWTRPGCLVLVASPTKRQSGLFLAKARALGLGLRVGLRKDPDHELSIRFPNGSLIVGLPAREATIRGFSSVSMLIIDEAARVPDIAYKAMRPMLAAVNGDLWLLSTPKGRRGFFYEQFMYGGERWTRFEVPATACPERISSEFLEEELAEMGPSWVKQEYFCEFLDTGRTVFNQQLVEDAVTDEIEPFVIPGGGLRA